MILADVNVLVYAFRQDAPDHEKYLGWLEAQVGSDRAYGLAEPVLAGFLRVVTNSRIFNEPSALDLALRFADELRIQPNCVLITPGRRHWEIFAGLCRAVKAKGNLIPDAWFAALAIESGSEWISTDGDFSRFPGLRWRHPLS
jgi:toxin-antitoxin system PIN domain toxin